MALAADPVHTVDDAAVEALAASGFRGPLLRPSDAEYDASRVIWNAMIDRRPALVARATGTADVVAAVRFAAEHDMHPAVRGGGHGAPGYAMCDGDLVIDLSLMRGVSVDPLRREAHVQGGCDWADVDNATQAHGLAVPGGAISHTGVGGLTLGGGIGWLSRAFGLTCDNLTGAEVVLADGTVAYASADSDAELLWGLRGGGGNFGVVTSLRFALHEVGPLVAAGVALFTMDRAEQVLRAYRDLAPASSTQLGLNLFAVHAGPMPGLPAELVWEPVLALGACFAGPLEEGMSALEPWRALEPDVDHLGPLPYVALQSMQDVPGRAGRHSYWKSAYTDALPDEAIEVYAEWCRRVPSKETVVELNTLGGAIRSEPDGGTAFHGREATFNHCIVSLWSERADTDANIAWTRGFFDAMQPFAASTVYSNFLSDEGADRVRAAYSDEAWARLVALKQRCDPDNRFRRNHNVPPVAD